MNRTAALVASLLASVMMAVAAADDSKDEGAVVAAAPQTMPPGFATTQSDAPAILKGRCNREQIGRVIGGAAIVGGAVIGAIIGGRIGRNMDEADRACVGQVLESGRTGTPVGWDSAAGERFVITPTRDYGGGQRERCREYVAGSEQRQARRAACRQDDGSWRTVAP